MKTVLILCTGNSCRSQMAEVALRRLGQGRFKALSAGAKPAGYVHPLALQVMQEQSWDVSGLRSKSLEEFRQVPIDVVITVCDRAHAACPVWPGSPVRIHWGFKDPAEAQGTEIQKKDSFRNILLDIERCIAEFVKLADDSQSASEFEKRANLIQPEPAK